MDDGVGGHVAREINVVAEVSLALITANHAVNSLEWLQWWLGRNYSLSELV